MRTNGFLGIVTTLVAGCGGVTCLPLQRRSCVCPGGEAGELVCAVDGSRWSQCNGCFNPVPRPFPDGPFSSCVGLDARCGPNHDGDCCESPIVTGGTFLRGDDEAIDEAFPDQSHPSTVSDFRLDRYEVSVGRFRAFVEAGHGTRNHPPPEGVGAHPQIPGSGWRSRWNAALTPTTDALSAAITPPGGWSTWTAVPEDREQRPISGVTWYEAFAFCAWDGGFLPSEAEWHYAASGGDEQRAYPWSVPAGSLTLDPSRAVYYLGPNGGLRPGGSEATRDVGSKSPLGDGRWGQSDLAGNVWEWTLDSYPMPPSQIWTYANPCVNCADLSETTHRSVRGGGFVDGDIEPSSLRSATRFPYPADSSGRNDEQGFRCARER